MVKGCGNTTQRFCCQLNDLSCWQQLDDARKRLVVAAADEEDKEDVDNINVKLERCCNVFLRTKNKLSVLSADNLLRVVY